MLKKTPLNAIHRAASARMVDFGGWDMPVNYGSQIDEHHAVRSDAGMFDVSHMRAVDLAGAGARDFLRHALATNIDKLKEPGKALYSCLLRENGGVLDDSLFTSCAKICSGSWSTPGRRTRTSRGSASCWRSMRRSCSSQPRDDQALIAVQGPNARAKVWQALPGAESATAALRPFFGVEASTPQGTAFIARTGYTGEDGFEIMVPATRAEETWRALSAAGVQQCGLGARDTLRLEAGMNLYGQDMDESISPLAAGLAWTVDLASPRDFVGKEALLDHLSTQMFAGLLLVEAGGVLRAHQKVHTGRGDGEVTSGTFSPTLQKSIALARLPVGVAIGDSVKVSVRDKQLMARVVKPPFVRHGKVLVE